MHADQTAKGKTTHRKIGMTHLKNLPHLHNGSSRDSVPATHFASDRVASAKASAGSYDQFFPGLGRGFFWPRNFFEFFRPPESPSAPRDAHLEQIPVEFTYNLRA